jgi:predicted nucleic acid-binding protein
MTVLIDSSAWIDHLSKRHTHATLGVARALRDSQAATTDQVVMEVFAGTTDAARLAAWQKMLNACKFLPQRPYEDAAAAASLYRMCRRAGETPRNLSDCLIAAIALRVDAEVLHNDRDYDVIARHTGLRAVRQ